MPYSSLQPSQEAPVQPKLALETFFYSLHMLMNLLMVHLPLFHSV